MGPGLVSLEMLFEALQSELVKSKFHALSVKVLKIPEFSLRIWVSNDKKAMPPTFEEATMPSQTPTFQIIETSSTTIPNS